MPITPHSASYAARSVDELLELLLPSLAPVAETEAVALAAARGRILAGDLAAKAPVPSFARSGVDGYALSRAAAEGERFLVHGRLTAGMSAEGLYCGDAAVRIFTGAMIPADAAAVAMQEYTAGEGPAIALTRPVPAGANIRPIGDDLPAGTVALRGGTRLDARHIAVAASVGATTLTVRRRLRVGTLTTGDELLDAGAALPPGRIVDTNTYLLSGLLEAAGFERIDLGRAADTPESLSRAFARAADCDAVITTGGVSVGEEDHVRPVVIAEGGRIDHWRVAIKPGKPLAVGRLGSGALFLGLPGNPNAVLVTLALIGLPLLRALAGVPHRPPPKLRLSVAEGFHRLPGRTEYVPVRVEGERAFRLGNGGSAQQAAMAAADALLIVPAEAERIDAGQVLDALPLSGLLG